MLVSIDDIEGLEITLDVLADDVAVTRIANGLRSLEAGEPGATLDEARAALARRRAAG